MRAAVYHGPHDVRIEEVDEPSRGEGQVLLEVLRSGMCGTDATEWSSGPKAFPLTRRHPVSGHVGPMVLGHEFVGRVLEADPYGRFAVGDAVASGAGVWCGECDRCREGRTNICRRYFTLGLNAHGGMAERVAVAERTLAAVPDGLSVDHAGLAQPVAVGLHAARRAGVAPGDRVVLIGAGAIGSFVLAGLRSLGPADITVVDFAGSRLERAARLGADRVVEVGPAADAELADVLGAAGADVVIEASGAPGQLDHAVHLLRAGGTILQVGLPSRAQELDVHTLVMHELTVRTTLAHVCPDDLGPALDILATSTLGGELLDSVRPLEDVPVQLERLATGALEGKVLIDPSRPPTV